MKVNIGKTHKAKEEKKKEKNKNTNPLLTRSHPITNLIQPTRRPKAMFSINFNLFIEVNLIQKRQNKRKKLTNT